MAFFKKMAVRRLNGFNALKKRLGVFLKHGGILMSKFYFFPQVHQRLSNGPCL